MSLFDIGELEEDLLFVSNFNMTFAATGTLETGEKIRYLCMLVRGEALHHFYLLHADLEITEILNMEYIIKGVSLYFPLMNLLLKKACNAPGDKNRAV